MKTKFDIAFGILSAFLAVCFVWLLHDQHRDQRRVAQHREQTQLDEINHLKARVNALETRIDERIDHLSSMVRDIQPGLHPSMRAP